MEKDVSTDVERVGAGVGAPVGESVCRVGGPMSSIASGAGVASRTTREATVAVGAAMDGAVGGVAALIIGSGEPATIASGAASLAAGADEQPLIVTPATATATIRSRRSGRSVAPSDDEQENGIVPFAGWADAFVTNVCSVDLTPVHGPELAALQRLCRPAERGAARSHRPHWPDFRLGSAGSTFVRFGTWWATLDSNQ
jgi:hypothetical protein